MKYETEPPWIVHRAGHLGAALVAYVPVGVALTRAGAVPLAVIGAVLTLACTPLPDYDERLPLLAHRGVTHTLAFAVCVGAGVALLVEALWSPSAVPCAATRPAGDLRTFGFVVGILAIGSHLVADWLTHAGVPVLWPVSTRQFSLGLVPADDASTNVGLFLAGLAGTAPWVFALLDGICTIGG